MKGKYMKKNKDFLTLLTVLLVSLGLGSVINSNINNNKQEDAIAATKKAKSNKKDSNKDKHNKKKDSKKKKSTKKKELDGYVLLGKKEFTKGLEKDVNKITIYTFYNKSNLIKYSMTVTTTHSNQAEAYPSMNVSPLTEMHDSNGKPLLYSTK